MAGQTEVGESSRTYYPVLKGREGEYKALRELSEHVRNRLTPIIEIPDIPWDFESEQPAKSIDAHLGPVPEKLERTWGARPLFVDLRLIADTTTSNGQHPLELVFDSMRERGLSAIPATGLDRDDEYQNAVASAAATDGRGVLIRLSSSDFEHPDALAADLTRLLQHFGVDEAACDVLIDLGPIRTDQITPLTIGVRSMFAMLPNLAAWRSTALASTAFPQDLSGFSAGSVGRAARSGLLLWQEVARNPGPAGRVPTYSDYGIQHPEMVEIDPRVMTMSASIRYTASDEWLILRGRSIKKAGWEQVRQLCAQLMSLPEFAGEDHCFGDRFISMCAGGGNTGNATTWRQVGTNHHVTFVAGQMANLRAT